VLYRTDFERTQSKEYGYSIVRVDTRGIGKSEGKLDPFGLERCQEIQDDAEGQGKMFPFLSHIFDVLATRADQSLFPSDLYDVIEWIGTQPWNTGRVAMAGISYYGMVGYWAAMQQPPHLTCVLSYESASDLHQSARRGGVYSSNFHEHWYNNIVVPSQHGANDGVEAAEMAANRIDYNKICENSEYADQGPWPVLRKARDLSSVNIPFYLAGNWTDPELHLPGNILAYNHISSEHKWLEMHSGNHIANFYMDDHVAYEKLFLDYFLMDKHDNGMLGVPHVRVLVRHGTKSFFRSEKAFPPADAQDMAFYFTANHQLVDSKPSGQPKAFEYAGLEGRASFDSAPFDESFEILGTPYLEVDVSTEAEDFDLFVYLRAIDTNGDCVILPGNHGEPSVSFCRGYWRLSHRDENQAFLQDRYPRLIPVVRSPVEKGKVYSVVVPLMPTSYLFDKGYKLQVELGSADEERTIPPMRHTGGDRTSERFGGKNTFFSSGRIVLPRVER